MTDQAQSPPSAPRLDISSLNIADRAEASAFRLSSASTEDAAQHAVFDCVHDPQASRLFASPAPNGALPRGPLLSLLDTAGLLGAQQLVLCLDAKSPATAASLRGLLYLGFELLRGPDRATVLVPGGSADSILALAVEVPEAEEEEEEEKDGAASEGAESTEGSGLSEEEEGSECSEASGLSELALEPTAEEEVEEAEEARAFDGDLAAELGLGSEEAGESEVDEEECRDILCLLPSEADALHGHRSRSRSISSLTHHSSPESEEDGFSCHSVCGGGDGECSTYSSAGSGSSGRSRRRAARRALATSALRYHIASARECQSVSSSSMDHLVYN